MWAFGRVDGVGVVGEGTEYLLVVLEQERVVVVDTVQHEHV